MEITNEIKAKVFAQYLGQKIYFTIGNYEVKFQWEFIEQYLKQDSPYKLILKPLSDITDEDASGIIDVCNKTGYEFEFDFESKISHGKSIAERFFSDNEYKAPRIRINTTISIYQYLQSKGYDLPHYLLGGKTLEDVGLAQYNVL